MSTLSESPVVDMALPTTAFKNSVATDAATVTSGSPASAEAYPSKTPGGSSKRKSTSLPSDTVEYLKNWMMSPQHIHHPYPSEAEKLEIIKETGITMKQLTNWFVNNRKRYWRPRVEARLQQQAQAAAVAAHAQAAVAAAVKVAAAQKVQQPQASAPLHQAPFPVSPEAGLKPTMSVPTPSTGAFVSFMDSNNSSPRVKTASPVLQQQEHVFPTLQPQSNATSDATKAVELLLAQAQQQHQPFSQQSPSLQTAGELTAPPAPVHTVAPTGSEGEMSDCSSDKDGSVVVHTFFEKDLLDKASTYARTVSMGSLDKLDMTTLTSEPSSVPTSLVTPTKKRTRTTASRTVTPQHTKYRRVSIDLWKDACRKASNFEDESLPSFEEASRLFGYTN